jgi:O-antigen/teichoic acid export membrane protein
VVEGEREHLKPADVGTEAAQEWSRSPSPDALIGPTEGVPPPDSDLLDTPQAGAAAIRGGALRLAGYGGGVALALASVPLLVRHLGVTEFGRYTLVVSIVAIVQGFTEGGLQAIGVREYSVLGPQERELMMRRLLALRVLLTAVGLGLALAFVALAGYDSTILVGTIVAGVGLLLLVLFNLLSVPLAAMLRFGWITAADLARQGLATILIIALVVAGAGIVPFLAVQIPACLLAVCITIALVRGMTPLAPAFHPSAWWSLLRDTLPYAVAIAISALYFRLVLILLSLLSNDTQTGYFSASYRVIEVLVAIPILLVGAAFPILSRAARDDSDRLAYAGQRTFDVMVILGVWISFCVAAGASVMIAFVGGADFEPSVPVLRIQAFAIACTFVSVTCGFILLSLRRHRAILLGNLVPLAFGTILTLALAPSHGAKGAAIATISAEAGLALAMLMLVTAKGGGGVPLSPLVLLPAAVAVGLAGGAALLTPGVPDVLHVVLGSAIYFAALAVMRQIPPELRHAIPLGRRAQVGA